MKTLRTVAFILVWFLVAGARVGQAVDSNSSCFIPSFDMCRVQRVIDGDTFQADCAYRGEGVKIRVLGIDTFESHRNSHIKKQATNESDINNILKRGRLAKRCAEKLILHKPVVLVFKDRRYDMYNRLLAEVYIITKNRFVPFVKIMNRKCKSGVFQSTFGEE